MTKRCPKCKSDLLEETSRRRYLLPIAICIAIILLCLFIYRRLSKQEMDIMMLSGIAACAIIAGIALVIGIVNVVKALRIKETLYRCRFCEHKFKTPVLAERSYTHEPIAQIKRKDK
jgi:hypothetical protein